MEEETTSKFDLCFRNVLFLISLRLAWQAWPGISLCLLFWAYSKFGDPLFRPNLVPRRRGLHFIAFIGGSLNAIATLANGGHMPVLGKAVASSVWVPLTDATRVKFLCDIHSGMSVGDMFIFVALAGFVLNWACEKYGLLTVSTQGERMPGLGL